MVRNFTILLYFVCLLVAIVYPANQHRKAVEAVTDGKLPEHAETIQQEQAAAISEPVEGLGDFVALPDAPQPEVYVPNSIKDFKTADPAEGISMITAPTANSTGNAILNFNMKLPPGRQGMQPALSIQYNNEGGISWLGYGWNYQTPAISIETRWGSPRYDASLETEMYTLNGELLAPTNNRAALTARSAEKRFYPRVEGSFNKIIRHGNNPSNYWWEVTDKMGVRNYFGGRPGAGLIDEAVLKDDLGNVAYWALVETRDPGENFVRYIYTTVVDPGVSGGTVPGRQLYISEILYTGQGSTDGPYKIEFIRDRQLGEALRRDVTIDGRLGFKMVSADLLRRVRISLNSSVIRSYLYNYEEGAFRKTLLKSVSELDDADAVFYTHHFDYYDDVNKQDYNTGAVMNTWTIGHDNIDGGIHNPIPGFTGEGSALNTVKANSTNVGVVVTVGSITGGTWSKNTTLGGGFNYSLDYTEGLVSMIDINGDGLPDKVFKDGVRLYYRANLGGATRSFGEKRPMNGIAAFSSGESENIGGGAQVIPPAGFFGYNYTRTTTTTNVYFTDFNGDGLMDIAANGQVYFNHLDAQGDPGFVTNSGLTPSPVFTGNIDGSFLQIDTARQRKQEQDFPLQDIIRVWEAPFDGTVNITAPIQLLDIPNQSGEINTKKDGVRASIQIGNTILDTALIAANDFTIKPMTIAGRNVVRGQRIYFRLQSRYNGEDDVVSWDPEIQYTSAVPLISDVHRKSSSYYKASEDFILHSKGTVGIGKIGDVIINGTFKKTITSDSVWAVVTRKRNNVVTTVFEQAFGNNELFDDSLAMPGQLAVDTTDEFYFSLVSRSYIDRSAVQWDPHFEFVSFADGTPVTGTDGKPTMDIFPVPDNSNYNHWYITAPPVATPVQDTVTLWPMVAGGGDGTLWFTIKGTDTVYARRRIFINGGTMNTAMDSIRMIRRANEPLFMEFATDSLSFAQSLSQPVVLVYKDSSFIRAGVPVDTLLLRDTVPSNLFANPDEDFLGPLFRGWGHFGFKGDKGDGPIDESRINLDELNNYPTDPNLYTDSASIGSTPDPSKTDFVMLFPNAGKLHWVGYDSSVYIQGGYMSSSRLWLHDVSVDSLMAGEASGAADKVSTTLTDSYSLGVTPGVVASAGTSFAETTVDLDMMDMNGDRYPDVLNEQQIQYTLPNGGLGTAVINQPVNTTFNKGFSVGVSLGGNFIEAQTQNSPTRAAATAMKTAKNSAGISGSLNTNDDESIRAWIDINGDGLVDRVYSHGTVQLNLGYRFADPENWGVHAIDRSNSTAAGAGLGVNIEAGSFEAGIGLSRTTGNNNFLLNDINGDGLPDQLFWYDSAFSVRLNTGNGFAPPISWKAFDAINTNISTGESINAAFSITIPIFFIKIVVNPGVNVGHGVSRQQKSIMDIDGDGYADMLTSDNDGHLAAALSTIGRTNMLCKVRGPIGGYVALDYERVGNTYDMPISKWVMKSVEVCDGVAGDGIDTTRRRFTYEDGYMDRYEREFYGFRRIITTDLNTANNNIVYRSRVQQFLNTSYYNKGLLVNDWVQDAAGNKFTQINHLYDVDTLYNFVHWPKMVQTEKIFYEGGAAADVRTVKEFQYDAIGNIVRISDAGDGTQQDMLYTDISYHNNDNAYIKAIPSNIEMTTAEGVKRKTAITINSGGNITRVRQFLADGTYADTDMEYDSYSNLSRVTRPANYKNQRMWYQYEYDNVTNSYVTSVTDAFGYTSTNTYDYRFGATTSTFSMHNEEMQYTLDNRGRLIRVRGPYELAAGKPYTIAFEYNPGAPVAYAITRHYDPEHDADIKTVSFSDGLGRVVQVKKLVSLFKGKGVADELKMVVSGSDLFDAFGRVEHSYYPILEDTGALNTALNTGTGAFRVTTAWDVQDRPTQTLLADGSTTKTDYTTDNGFFSEMTTDALNNRKEIRRDVRDRRRFIQEFGPDGAITTRYNYNALSELLKIVDNDGNEFIAAYDNLGRRVSEQHPDAGLTEYQYDLSGNLLKKITAQIRKEIPNGGAIQYQYEYERLTDIDYPRQYQNKVKYEYGAAGAGNKTGRLVLQLDASGGQEFFYGKMGEITKVIRTVMVSPLFATTYVTEQQYDSWNRLKTLSYPDGEVVRYHYNRGGKLNRVEGVKTGHTYKYVDQLGYDEYEDRVYMLYGNGAETRYTFDNQRRRLTTLQSGTATGHELMNYQYTYDAVSNITGIENDVTAQTGKPGGYSKHQYQYDNLYRLDSAQGEYEGASESSQYGLKVAYDNLNNIVRKTMRGANEYDNAYVYGGEGPHQPKQTGDKLNTYDRNGNRTAYGEVENFWDEENRLMAVLNKGMLSQYTYDADGERVIRSSGGIQGIWVNGAPAGAVKHDESYTVYVNPFISCKKFGFVKHYYVENQRIASKQGHGTFTNISFPQPGLTAGGIDYARRAALMEEHRRQYYASLGVSPGPPTDKNYWARPENSGIPAPVFVDSTATNVPPGWPGNTTPPPDGPPIFVDPVPSRDSVRAGYGFREAGQFYESGQYFLHADHLGSTAYVTNTLGEACQHFEYSPFGETFFEEAASSYITPYLYTGKGRDDESGYYFHGARYYDPLYSLWLSVDLSREPGPGGYSQRPVKDKEESANASGSGGAFTGDIVFGDAGIGMALSAWGHGGDDDDGNNNDKSKKTIGRSPNVQSKPVANRSPNPRTQQQAGNANKRAFRQPGMGLQNAGGMFFSHGVPNQNNNTGGNVARRTQIKTRPRR